MKNARRFAFVAVLAALACVRLTYGTTCRIEVDKGSASIDDGTTNASFVIKPQGCKSCSGIVRFKIYYKSSNNEDHFYVGGKVWTSTDGSSVDAVAEGYESYCTNKSFGPCRVKAWEIFEKTCYEH